MSLRLTGQHELELEPVVREAIQLAGADRAALREDCPVSARSAARSWERPHDHEEEPRPAARGAAGVPVDGRRETR